MICCQVAIITDQFVFFECTCAFRRIGKNPASVILKTSQSVIRVFSGGIVLRENIFVDVGCVIPDSRRKVIITLIALVVWQKSGCFYYKYCKISNKYGVSLKKLKNNFKKVR